MTRTSNHTNRPSTTSRTRSLGIKLGVAAMTVAIVSGCSAQDKVEPLAPPGSSTKSGDTKTGSVRVLFTGDSVAKTQAPALEAALTSAGATFSSIAEDGGGNIVDTGDDLGEQAKQNLADLVKTIKKEKATTVVYQITTYDWGTEKQQEESYTQLASDVDAAGAKLVIVSGPPVTIDDFYAEHAKEMATAPAAAQKVAAAHQDTVTFLDASDLWGTDVKAAKALRGPDGIHSCQQGAAAFAAWFGKQSQTATGLTPVAAKKWATSDWTDAKVFAEFHCPAAGR